MKSPQVFGKYLLLERISVGGMAEIFIAKAFGVEGFERILAIKKILPTMAEDEEFITMFIDEARISSQLNHANVVHIHELGRTGADDAYYIAMEYVPGLDLRAIAELFRRERQPMPVPMACFIVSKVCEGLDYAHRKKDGRGQPLNIVHRDVSPQNVIISYEGEVKIIDFGIAKAANRSQHTQVGILKGKFGYMSPEQAMGKPIDHRSDLFAVGVMLYELLTGDRLFVGESDFSVVEKVRNAQVLSPRELNPEVPKALEKVILKALAKDVNDRYQWCSELQEDLLKFLVAGNALYSSKTLSYFMKEAFAEDISREVERMERFAQIQRPDEIEDSSVEAIPRRRSSKNIPVAAPPTSRSMPAAQAAPGGSARRPESQPGLKREPLRPAYPDPVGRRMTPPAAKRVEPQPPPVIVDDDLMDAPPPDRTQIVDTSQIHELEQETKAPPPSKAVAEQDTNVKEAAKVGLSAAPTTTHVQPPSKAPSGKVVIGEKVVSGPTVIGAVPEAPPNRRPKGGRPDRPDRPDRPIDAPPSVVVANGLEDQTGPQDAMPDGIPEDTGSFPQPPQQAPALDEEPRTDGGEAFKFGDEQQADALDPSEHTPIAARAPVQAQEEDEAPPPWPSLEGKGETAIGMLPEPPPGRAPLRDAPVDEAEDDSEAEATPSEPSVHVDDTPEQTPDDFVASEQPTGQRPSLGDGMEEPTGPSIEARTRDRSATIEELPAPGAETAEPPSGDTDESTAAALAAHLPPESPDAEATAAGIEGQSELAASNGFDRLGPEATATAAVDSTQPLDQTAPTNLPPSLASADRPATVTTDVASRLDAIAAAADGEPEDSSGPTHALSSEELPDAHAKLDAAFDEALRESGTAQPESTGPMEFADDAAVAEATAAAGESAGYLGQDAEQDDSEGYGGHDRTAAVPAPSSLRDEEPQGYEGPDRTGEVARLSDAAEDDSEGDAEGYGGHDRTAAVPAPSSLGDEEPQGYQGQDRTAAVPAPSSLRDEEPQGYEGLDRTGEVARPADVGDDEPQGYDGHDRTAAVPAPSSLRDEDSEPQAYDGLDRTGAVARPVEEASSDEPEALDEETGDADASTQDQDHDEDEATRPERVKRPVPAKKLNPKLLIFGGAGVAAVAVVIVLVALLGGGGGGALVVLASPPDAAKILLDGKPIANGEVVAGVAEGEHELVVSAPGFETQSQKIRTGDAQSTVTVALQREAPPEPPPEAPPETAAQQTAPEPAQPEPAQPEKPPEQTVPASGTGTPTPHVAAVEPTKTEPAKTEPAKTEPVKTVTTPTRPPPEVEPAPKPEKVVTSTPKKKTKGQLAVTSNPQGAEIFIDGRPTNRKTPVPFGTAIDVPTGSHTLLLKAGGKKFSQKIVVEDGEMTIVRNAVLK